MRLFMLFLRLTIMELMDFAVLGMVSAGFSLVFSAICGYVTVWLRDYRVSKLEKAVESLTMARNNDKAQEAREVRAMEKTKAMVELGTILKSTEGDKKQLLMEWAASNPDFVLTMAKKFGINL